MKIRIESQIIQVESQIMQVESQIMQVEPSIQSFKDYGGIWIGDLKENQPAVGSSNSLNLVLVELTSQKNLINFLVRQFMELISARFNTVSSGFGSRAGLMASWSK